MLLFALIIQPTIVPSQNNEILRAVNDQVDAGRGSRGVSSWLPSLRFIQVSAQQI